MQSLRGLILGLMAAASSLTSFSQTNLFDQASGANTYFGGYANFNWVNSWSGFLPTAGTQLFASATNVTYLNLGLTKNLGGAMTLTPYTVSLNIGYYFGSPVSFSTFHSLYIGSALGTMNWTSTPTPSAPDVWYTWTGTYTPVAGDVGQPFMYHMLLDQTGNRSITLDLSFNFVVLLQLGEFKARRSGADVQLSWQLPADADAQQFRIERSADGRQFETVAEFAPHGGANYEYTDPAAATLPARELTYRIAIIDRNGAEQMSDVSKINIEHEGSPLAAAWFDALAGQLIISQLGEPVPASIVIMDVSGKQLIELNTTAQRTAVPAEALAPGVYFVKISAAGGRSQVVKVSVNP